MEQFELWGQYKNVKNKIRACVNENPGLSTPRSSQIEKRFCSCFRAQNYRLIDSKFSMVLEFGPGPGQKPNNLDGNRIIFGG